MSATPVMGYTIAAEAQRGKPDRSGKPIEASWKGHSIIWELAYIRRSRPAVADVEFERLLPSHLDPNTIVVLKPLVIAIS